MTDAQEIAASPQAAEELRQAALFAAGILGMSAHPALRAIVERAARQLNVPIVAISVIDRDRQWFPACVGLDVTETSRDLSFCAHAILAPEEIMCIPDATLDPRFKDNALVTGPLGIRFYASVPLVTNTGAALGALCIIDRVPRPCPTQAEREMLAAFGREVLAEVERPENVRFFSPRAIELIVAQISQAAAANNEPLMLALDGVLRSVERTIATTQERDGPGSGRGRSDFDE
jgi:GAF domain-containing protein